MATDVRVTCRFCGEVIELRDSDDRPGRQEWVEVGGNDPQCDAAPSTKPFSNNHWPIAELTRRSVPILTNPWD